MGYSIIVITGLPLDLKIYGPFAAACCSFFSKLRQLFVWSQCTYNEYTVVWLLMLYEQRIKFCSVLSQVLAQAN